MNISCHVQTKLTVRVCHICYILFWVAVNWHIVPILLNVVFNFADIPLLTFIMTADLNKICNHKVSCYR